jgi:hypothetical protein
VSTVPSTDPDSTPPPRGRADFTPPIGMGFLPGSAELLVWILALIVAMLVTWIGDTLGAADWFTFFLWTTAAYLLSRGIAKATRVYEM